MPLENINSYRGLQKCKRIQYFQTGYGVDPDGQDAPVVTILFPEFDFNCVLSTEGAQALIDALAYELKHLPPKGWLPNSSN